MTQTNARGADYTGLRFGRLTALERLPETQDRYALWRCRCDCGGECVVSTRQLSRGSVKSCGCDAPEDLTGRRFDSLTVVSRVGAKRYLCRCDCGQELTVSASDLLRGHKKSCGCRKRQPRSEDLTGLRVGRLTVLGLTDQSRRAQKLWRCRCDCGQELLAESYRLKNGLVTSCGCARKSSRDLTGRTFGALTALERLNEKQGSCYLWRCRCECGNEIDVPTDKLTGGRVKSCGCLQDPRRHLHFIGGTCVEQIGSAAVRSDNTSGVTGVFMVRGRWRAAITFQKKTYYLGEYDTLEEAAFVRRRAEDRLFGEFLEWYHAEFSGQEK